MASEIYDMRDSVPPGLVHLVNVTFLPFSSPKSPQILRSNLGDENLHNSATRKRGPGEYKMFGFVLHAATTMLYAIFHVFSSCHLDDMVEFSCSRELCPER